MISFRYHITSLVAVLLALAAGVALGSGPLQREDVTSESPRAAAKTSSALTTALQATSEFNDAFVGSLGPTLITDRLAGRAVTLVSLPDAPPEAVSSISADLAKSGASLTGTVKLSEDLVSATNKQLVDELGSQLEAAATRVTVPTDAGSYERVGVLLAHAIGTKTPAGDAVDGQGKGILAGLSTAGLVSIDADLQRRGGLLVVVAGPPDPDPESAQGTASIVVSLLSAFDEVTGGVVLAGPQAAAEGSGTIAAVRGDAAAAKAVSTVDSADHPAGAVVTVLALAEQAGQKAGQYGAGETASGPLPGVAASR